MMDDGVITDSAGVKVRSKRLEELRKGDKIIGGWKPWLVLDHVGWSGATSARMIFEDGHKGGWISPAARVLVEVDA